MASVHRAEQVVADGEDKKAVIRARNREQYLKNRDKRIADQKAYYEANRDKIKAQRSARRQAGRCREVDRANYARHRDTRLAYAKRQQPVTRIRSHGLTVAEYGELVARQGNLCAICETPGPGRIDHDHATGRVRGLLCHNCNVALGHLRDDPALLARAIEYLREAT